MVATTNSGKLSEYRALLADFGVHVLSLDDFPGAPEVDEDLDTLEGNAAKKARIIRDFTGVTTLADDTGLEVGVLGGRPGVWSARFAGPAARDTDNRKLLLEQLQDQADRRAQFRTVIALSSENELRTFEGVCAGSISRSERGKGGFGYDSIFVPDGWELTFAEMSPIQKNTISHRARALDALEAWWEKEKEGQ